jgi:hypothetical protein
VKLTPRIRRVAAGAAIASAAILLPAIALASSAGGSSHAASSQSAARQSAASVHRCTRGQLTTWLGFPGSGAAGSTFYELEISNISGPTCTLYGYPGVSAFGRLAHQLGSAAQRSPGQPVLVVTLRHDQTAHVILQLTEVGNYSPSACRPVTAYGLTIYAPGDYDATSFPFSFAACSRRGPVYLHVSSTVAGTGIPGYSV